MLVFENVKGIRKNWGFGWGNVPKQYFSIKVEFEMRLLLRSFFFCSFVFSVEFYLVLLFYVIEKIMNVAIRTTTNISNPFFNTHILK